MGYYVAQKDEMGCGVACVASLLGLSYDKTLSLFGKSKIKAKEEGFICKDLIEVLNKMGLEYEYKYIKLRLRQEDL